MNKSTGHYLMTHAVVLLATVKFRKKNLACQIVMIGLWKKR